MTVAELMPDGASALTTRLNQEGIYEGPTPEIYPGGSQYDFSPPGFPDVAAIAITADGAHFAASGWTGYGPTPWLSLFEHVAGYPLEPYAQLVEPDPVLGMAFAADGSKLFVVEHGTDTTMRVITGPLRPGTFIAVNQSDSQIVDAYDYNATLRFSDGASPLGKSVTLTMTDPNGTQTSLGNATADAQGTLVKTLSDPFDRAGIWVLRSTYPGDPNHQRFTSINAFRVNQRAASLDIHVTPGALTAGTTATIGGTLTLDGTDSVAGRDVAVYATPPGGAETLLDTVQTDQAGAYAIQRPLGGGAWSFRAAYAGDVRYAPADSAHLSVSVGFQKPAVSLVAGRSLVTYGDRVALTATLGPTHTNRAVRIIRIAGDGSRSLVAQGQVDAKGHLGVSTTPGRTLRYVAEFAGDDWFAPRSAGVRVRVRAAVTLAANNAYRTVGGVGVPLSRQLHHDRPRVPKVDRPGATQPRWPIRRLRAITPRWQPLGARRKRAVSARSHEPADSASLLPRREHPQGIVANTGALLRRLGPPRGDLRMAGVPCHPLTGSAFDASVATNSLWSTSQLRQCSRSKCLLESFG